MRTTASESTVGIRLLAAAGAVTAPVALLPAAPLASAAVGVACAHLWFLNQGGKETQRLAICPVSIAIATSGFGWLVAGMMLLSRMS
jgi:hypothetical protein